MDTGTIMCRKHYHVLNLYPGVFYARHQMQNSRDWFHSTDIHHFNKQMVPYKNIITLKHTRTLKTGLANNMKHMGLISIWVDFHKAGNFGSSAHHASSPRSSQLHFRSDLGIISGMVGGFLITHHQFTKGEMINWSSKKKIQYLAHQLNLTSKMNTFTWGKTHGAGRT